MTGVLDIAKCLYDAVSRLQRTAKRKSVDGGNANEAELSMLAELGKGKGKKSKAAMQVIVMVFFRVLYVKGTAYGTAVNHLGGRQRVDGLVALQQVGDAASVACLMTFFQVRGKVKRIRCILARSYMLLYVCTSMFLFSFCRNGTKRNETVFLFFRVFLEGRGVWL